MVMTNAPNTPPPLPGNNNPYEFIANPKQPQRKLPGGQSKNQRILFVVGGAVVLLVIGMLVASLLGNANKGVKQDILTALQYQTELVRVSEIGLDEASSPSTRNLAATVNLSLTSDKDPLLAMADKVNLKVDKQLIAAGQNSQIDADLETAKQRNRFDEEFTAITSVLLNEYLQSLQRIYDQSSNPQTQATLSEMYTSAEALIAEETAQN